MFRRLPRISFHSTDFIKEARGYFGVLLLNEFIGGVGERQYVWDMYMMWTFLLILLAFVNMKVTCIIMQKNGAGMTTAVSCFWDSSTDGTSPTSF